MKRLIGILLIVPLLLVGCSQAPETLPLDIPLDDGVKETPVYEPVPRTLLEEELLPELATVETPEAEEPSEIGIGNIACETGALVFEGWLGGHGSNYITVRNKSSENQKVEFILALPPKDATKEGFVGYAEALNWISFAPTMELAPNETKDHKITVDIPTDARPPTHCECWIGVAEAIDGGARPGYFVRILVSVGISASMTVN